MKSACIYFMATLMLSGLMSFGANAQTRQERHQTTETQIQLNELASDEIQNFFSEPQTGVIYRKDSQTSKLMNYNVLLDLFYVVEGGRETWLMPWESDSVRIGDHLFYYYHQVGYFEVISEMHEELVLRRHMMDVSAQTVAVGAYGTPSQVASTEAVRSVHDSSEFESVHSAAVMRNPGGQELHITLRREEAFYMVPSRRPVSINSRRALRREFPDHSRDLSRYVRRNDIEFKSKDEMIQLAEYVRSLLNSE